MNKQLIISVGLIERNSRFLFTRRLCNRNPQWHHRWELPGGKIEAGETPEDALHREIFEETKLQIQEPRLLGVYTHHWKVPNGVQQTFILLYHCHAVQDEVVLSKEENDAYRWDTFEDAVQRIDLLDGTLEMLNTLAFQKEGTILN